MSFWWLNWSPMSSFNSLTLTQNMVKLDYEQKLQEIPKVVPLNH